MTTVAVIPARFASTRFPGKPLARETGKFLIQHVCEQVGSCSQIDRVIVATDDERIVSAVESFGGQAMMTRVDHVSGTDRVGEVASNLGLDGNDLVLNVQGDEPEVSPVVLDRLIQLMTDPASEFLIGTLAARFDDTGPSTGPGSPADPNCVKVVVDRRGRALYFSRGLIPYSREPMGRVNAPSGFLLHLGVYAFRANTLQEIAGDQLAPGVLEQTESLEQLRWMEHGFSIGVAVVDHRCVGIDTKEDYAAFVQRISSAPSRVRADV